MLELIDLRKTYGDVVALDGVTFSVEPGHIVGFVGPNGAGKTTTMRIALGVLQPDSGDARWCGRPIDATARRRFGYMPEERGLYPKMRVHEQLVYFARLHGMPAAAAVAAADHWVERLGVEMRAGDEVDKLSLGNQQRVQLAAALVHSPDVLVLDEPFSGLDPVGVDVLSGVLRERVDDGAAIVFSSHQLELVERLCDEVGIVVGGRMVANGRVRDLRRRPGVCRLRLVVAGPASWVDGIAGATVVEQHGDTVVIDVPDSVDPAAVLDAARAAGPVSHFSEIEPSLTDIFREVAA